MTRKADSHPGAYLLHELDVRGWTTDECSDRTNLSRETIEALLQERQRITEVIAGRLAAALGHERATWLAWQDTYDRAKKTEATCSKKRD